MPPPERMPGGSTLNRTVHVPHSPTRPLSGVMVTRVGLVSRSFSAWRAIPCGSPFIMVSRSLSALFARVECVIQAVADEVRRHDCQEQDQSRHENQVRVGAPLE